MSKTYEDYEREQLNTAVEQNKQYAADRLAQAQKAAMTSDGLYNSAVTAAEKDYAQSAADAERSQRALYDANVVNELIMRRHAEEAIANSNARRSGLNNTQQTAVSLARSRADAEVTRQKQAMVNAIMRELDKVRDQYRQDKTAASAAIYAKADEDILSNREALNKAAKQQAASLYKTDLDAQAAQAEMTYKQETAQAEQAQKLYEKGYEYDPETGHYTYVGMFANQTTEQAYREKMAEQGYAYDTDLKLYIPLGSAQAVKLYYIEKEIEEHYKEDGAVGAKEFIDKLAQQGQITEELRKTLTNKYYR